MLNATAARADSKGTGPTLTIQDGQSYAIDIEVGGKTYAVSFDTGSSAFWLPSSNFTCLYENKTAMYV
jgi:hypothetical protein